ncbi:MAG TPA: hypothetical protein VED41_09535 [Solirubrobacteraceae bacterium]|nr:hypothetical protein [Solirubrobacteraceae bacterium]
MVAGRLAAPAGALADACPNAQFRVGPSQRLPDCRAFERVSPAETGGLDAVTLEPMEPEQSSACEADQTCTLAYMNIGASFAGALGNELLNAYLATRTAAGWQTTPLSPPTPQAPPDSSPRITYAFSSDLSEAVLRVPLQQLTEDAPPNVYNLFLREPAGAYSLVTSVAPPEPPASGCGSCFEVEDVPVFAGASSDFSHILFEANDGLEGAPSGEIEVDGEPRHIENLYEAAGGRVRAVGVLPDGTIAAHGASAGAGLSVIGEQGGELEHAISQNGERVLFTAEADGGAPAPQQAGKPELYDRIDGASTVELSAPAAGARPGECETQAGMCDPEPAQFWAASADGSAVYFTSKAALTSASFTGPEESLEARHKKEKAHEPVANPGDDLYRYDLDGGGLTDLTADAGNVEDPDGADVLGVVGASEDGSYVYFVAAGHLGETAPRGQVEPLPNLYVWHETAEGAGSVRFIATLAPPNEGERKSIEKMRTGAAFSYNSDILDWSEDPRASQAYVTPNGTHLAFMSVEPLTGYDNRQTVIEGGKERQVADHEVFEYSAETGQLVCASCDPTGAEPRGSAFIGASLTERASTPFHQPRSLSDDGGRLFFSSPDPLVTGTAGGTDKVFEYEDGAAQLISGAQAGEKAVFLDAGASGDDVFFATREQLEPGDSDELMDVYDARVDGGLAAPASQASCQAGACEPAPGSLSPSQEPFPTLPGSASFEGPGNLSATAAKPAPAKARRAQLLARALADCRKRKQRRQRAACEALARRRYGPMVNRKRRAPEPRLART